jgi:hypothetical protein
MTATLAQITAIIALYRSLGGMTFATLSTGVDGTIWFDATIPDAETLRAMAAQIGAPTPGIHRYHGKMWLATEVTRDGVKIKLSTRPVAVVAPVIEVVDLTAAAGEV